MRIFLFIFLFSIAFFECTKRDKVPGHILSQQKMQAIMWDMMRADRFISNFVLSKDTSLNADSVRINLYQRVFLIHNISKEKFRESFDYYKDHTHLLKILLDSLDVRQNTNNEAQIKPVPWLDTTHSFKRIKKLLHD